MQHDEPAEKSQKRSDSGSVSANDGPLPDEAFEENAESKDALPPRPATIEDIELPRDGHLPSELASRGAMADVHRGENPLGPADAGRSAWPERPDGEFRSVTAGAASLHRLASAPQPTRRTGDALMGLLVLILAFVASLIFSLWARDAAMHPAAAAPGPPRKDLLGFPEEVRPFEILPAVRDATERQLFQGFVAEGMRRDGSVDLSKKGNSLRFAFQDQRGRGAQPAREGGTLPLRTFCGRQSVVVLADGLVAREDQPEVPCRHPEPRELPLPTTCRLQDAWKIAKQQGLRVSKPAVVEYYRSKGGPAYRFVQKRESTKSRTVVLSARDCRSILNGKDQRGSVP